jgi:hypothetical protein
VSVRSPSFTILGAGGDIGSAPVGWLASQDQQVHAVTRAALPALLAARRQCGHVIACIGLTGDFRSRPIDTADAHVGLVARCPAELRFESFLLLSSTRVYRRAGATHEDTVLPSLPADPSDLAQRLRECFEWQVRFEAEAPTVQPMSIDTSRLDAEFRPTSSSLSADLPTLLAPEQECQCSPSTNPAAA